MGGILTLYAIPLGFIPGISEGMTAAGAIGAWRNDNRGLAAFLGVCLILEIVDITGLGDDAVRAIINYFKCAAGNDNNAIKVSAALGNASPGVKDVIAKAGSDAIRAGNSRNTVAQIAGAVGDANIPPDKIDDVVAPLLEVKAAAPEAVTVDVIKNNVKVISDNGTRMEWTATTGKYRGSKFLIYANDQGMFLGVNTQMQRYDGSWQFIRDWGAIYRLTRRR